MGVKAAERRWGEKQTSQERHSIRHAVESGKEEGSGGTAERFSGSVGVSRAEGNGGDSDGQSGDMSDGVKIFSA